jgi:hypothetical protein
MNKLELKVLSKNIYVTEKDRHRLTNRALKMLNYVDRDEAHLDPRFNLAFHAMFSPTYRRKHLRVRSSDLEIENMKYDDDDSINDED